MVSVMEFEMAQIVSEEMNVVVSKIQRNADERPIILTPEVAEKIERILTGFFEDNGYVVEVYMRKS